MFSGGAVSYAASNTCMRSLKAPWVMGAPSPSRAGAETVGPEFHRTSWRRPRSAPGTKTTLNPIDVCKGNCLVSAEESSNRVRHHPMGRADPRHHDGRLCDGDHLRRGEHRERERLRLSERIHRLPHVC